MRASWTDKRLDEFRGDVNERFGRVEGQIEGLRAETHAEFIALRGEMKSGFETIAESSNQTHRLMIQSAIGMAAAFATIVAGLLGLIATQV